MNTLSKYTTEISDLANRIQAVTRATVDEIDEFHNILHMVCESIVDDRLVDAITLLYIVVDSAREIEVAVDQIEELNRRKLKEAVTTATA